MDTQTTTRPVTIQGRLIQPGTPVLASYSERSGLTTVEVPGIGARDFLAPPF